MDTTMDLWNLGALLPGVGVGLALVGGYLSLWRWRVRRWCQEHKLELLGWRGAQPYEGPDILIRRDYQRVFWIDVRDSAGTERTGYLVFGNPYIPFSGDIEVLWE